MIQVASTKDLVVLSQRILALSADLTWGENQSALRHAVRPVLKSMQQRTPIGKGGYRTGSKGVGRGSGRSSLEYRRGGATKMDTRILSLRHTNKREAVVLVGVSRKHGHVGWRTHFLLHGTKKMKRNDYMIKALNENLDKIPVRYESKMRKIIDKNLLKKG